MKKRTKKRVKHSYHFSLSKRTLVLSGLLLFCFTVVGFQLIRVMGIHGKSYEEKLATLSVKESLGPSAPRGRIYDRNYRLLVDNKAIRSVSYQRPKKMTTKEEVDLAYRMSNILTVDSSKLLERNLREFWLVEHKDEGNKKITKEEWDKLEMRKLSVTDIENLIIMRITEEELAWYDEAGRKAAYLYYLMNRGYSYDKKLLSDDVTEEEYAYLAEQAQEFPGVVTHLSWERTYPYGDTFRSILGTVSTSTQGLPKEQKDIYLKKGYALSDRVGISYLEEQYEELLQGKKERYEVLSTTSKQLIQKGERGKDIVLTIDIELQKAIEQVMEEEMLYTKGQPNTKHYNRNYVIIQDPNNGEILAMCGKEIVFRNGSYVFYDDIPGALTNPMTVGSVIKGASMLTGYQTAAVKIGEYLEDECIKIASTPQKCSWKVLGRINDLQALALSSNVYQFKIAMRVGKGKYIPNGPLELDPEAFTTYRTMFHQFGLGVKTEIDLPVESLGYTGSSTLPGYLLDFSMGQYDTYTPVQLSQYISTIANHGTRYQPRLLKEVHEASSTDEVGKLLYAVDPNILNKVDVKSEYLDRIQQGFYQVTHASNGLGRNYFADFVNGSGKTGTSQSFKDTNADGKIDTETISTAFVGYAPSDNPKMSIIVTSPDVSYPNPAREYLSLVTRRITKRATEVFFSPPFFTPNPENNQ